MKLFTGGDWPLFYIQAIKELPWWPQAWSSFNGNGFGQNVSFVLGYKTFFALITKFLVVILHIPWNIAEQLIFFIPFCVLAATSSYFLSRFFFKEKAVNILSSVIYTTNTYSLMLVGGGQQGVALAYAMSPFLLLSFLRLFQGTSKKHIIYTSLLLGFLLCIDPRIAGILLTTSFIFLLFSFSWKNLRSFVLCSVLGVLLNSFWIIPFLFSGTSGLSDAYTGTDILSFLSFATFEDSIALLHPNWPENIFGYVHFMKPEFIALPIVAFSSLFFIGKPVSYKKKSIDLRKTILAFALVGLIGAFLGKGVSLPFGSVYYFLSNHVPGFIMFRDPTKWYGMIAISYAILIPFTLYYLTKYISEFKKSPKTKLQFIARLRNFKFRKEILIGIFLIFWFITIRQLFLRELTGTFQVKTIPYEYIRLEKMLSQQHSFSRTLWVPEISRFGYISNNHPGIAMYDLVISHDVKPTFKYLDKKTTERFIQESAVEYLIVPFDPLGEIYLTDREYDPKVYNAFLRNTKNISWLQQDKSFKQIGVFKVKSPQSLSYNQASGKPISLKQVSLTKYKGRVGKSTDSISLVFAQTYDKHWVLKVRDKTINSTPYNKRFNSFRIPGGTTNFTIEYTTQRWVNIGVAISLVTVGILILGLKLLKK